MKILDYVISSRANPTVKWAASLKDKKVRDIDSVFMVEGEKLSYEAIESGLNITHIFIAESKAKRVLKNLESIFNEKKHLECVVYILTDDVFSKISTEMAPQGIISVIKHLDFFRKLDIIYKEEFLQNPSERIMILSSLQDPGNLGSVIRSAAALGCRHIILSSDSCDIYNPKVIRSAMGSLFNIKVTYVKDLVGTILNLRTAGRRVYSAELNSNAMSLSEATVFKSDVIIIGNEGHGVSKELSSASDGAVYIPITDATESLNASVAAAIFMWVQK